MATIVQNIENIKDVKADIRDAIIEKGIDMENVPFTDYAIKISEITGGGSELDKPVATGIFTSAKLLTECLPYGHFNNLNVKVGINSYIQRTKFEFEYRRTNPDVATFFKMSDATEAANLTLTQTSNNLITLNYYNSSNGETITGSSEINETGEFHTIIVDIPNMKFIVDGVINNLEGVTPSRLLLKSLWLIDAYTIDVKRVDIFDSDNITNIRYIRPTEIGDFAYIPVEWTTGNISKTLYTPTNSENYEYITTGTPVYFDKICVDNTTKDILEFDVPNNDFYTRVDVTDLKYLDIYSYIQNRVSVEENTQLNNQTATEAITITENGTYTYPMEDGSYIWYSNSSSAPAVNIIDNLFGGWIAAQDDIIEVEFRATNSMIGTKIPWLFGKSDEAFSTTKNKYGIELNQGSSGCWLNFWMGKKLGKYFFKSGQWVKVKTYPNPADTTERIIEIDDGGYNNITTTISNTAMTTNLQKKTQLFGLLSSTSNYGGVLPAIHLKYIKVWSSSEDKENNIYKYGLLATNGMNNIDNCVISTLEGNSVKIECAQVVNLHNYQKGWNNITVDVPSGGTGDYDTGFEDGVAAQKALMTTATFNRNGTYTREDGYNEVVVNVPSTLYPKFFGVLSDTIGINYHKIFDYMAADGDTWTGKLWGYVEQNPDKTSNGMMYEFDSYSDRAPIANIYMGNNYNLDVLNLSGTIDNNFNQWGMPVWGKKSLVTPWVYNVNNSPTTTKILPDCILGGFECGEVEYINRVFEGAETLRVFQWLHNLGKSFTSVNTLDLSILTNLNDDIYGLDSFIEIANSVYDFAVDGMNVNGISYSNVKLPTTVSQEAIDAWIAKGWTVMQ